MGVVAGFAADDTLLFASPVAVSDTNPHIAGVFPYDGYTWVHVVRGTGVMEGLLGYDTNGEHQLHAYDDDRNYRASVSVAVGDYLYRLGHVSGDNSTVSGTSFEVVEQAVVMARGQGTREEWAHLVGPSPGAVSVAVASGVDILAAGVFSEAATFGMDPGAQKFQSAGSNDIFLAKIELAGTECHGRPGDAGFPEVPIPIVCPDPVDEFQSTAKEPGSTFDWNCDGVEQHELDTLNYGCSWSGAGCPSPGWLTGTVPRCGESGNYSNCSSSGRYTCSSGWETRQQRCK